jgi:CO/xanthine dehydrogenase Mo-binding subunit
MEDTEFDVLGFSIHPDDSVASNAPNCGVFEGTNIGPTSTYIRGDVEVGFAEADEIIEVDMTGWCRPHTMNTIEPNSACVWWEGDDVYGYDVNQAPHSYGRAAAGYLGIPHNRYHVQAHAAGGGFGGGGQTREPVAAALLSKKTGKPVQITRSRRNQSPTRRNKYAVNGRIKVGCKSDGRMTALEIEAYSWGGRNGANSNWMQIVDTTFDCANISYTSHSIATNTGFGAGWR